MAEATQDQEIWFAQGRRRALDRNTDCTYCTSVSPLFLSAYHSATPSPSSEPAQKGVAMRECDIVAIRAQSVAHPPFFLRVCRLVGERGSEQFLSVTPVTREPFALGNATDVGGVRVVGAARKDGQEVRYFEISPESCPCTFLPSPSL